MKSPKRQKGFSIIESLLAITVVLVGVGGAVTIATTSIRAGSASNDELIASHLAEEGIEIVRQTRDDYWLRGMDYGDMEADGWLPREGNTLYFRVFINNNGVSVIQPSKEINPDPFADFFLLMQFTEGDMNGLYTHESGDTKTPFYRGIVIKRAGPLDPVYLAGSMVVTSRVYWKTGEASEDSVVLQEAIYDWR